MIKVRVIESFTLVEYDKLKNIQRKSIEEKGKLFIGDTFECDKEMAEYLLGNNKNNRPYIKIIEIIPERRVKNVKQ